ncbi:MATE family efflux transporter [Sphingomonas soli]|uniref:MATE family efflux transporter n=1 Tax=Sphingomonas soli TaxID=266127 RepID=UPI00082B0456|nr:MATE family efflux transporter [Sphingomonas soli]
MKLTPALSAETRRILALAWPVMLTSLNWTLIQLTDIVVLGWTGTEQVAQFGASRTLLFVVVMVGLGSLTGVIVHASRADGAGDHARTGAVLHHGLVLSLALGLAVGAVLYFFALPLLDAVGVAPEIAPGAARVVEAIAFAYPCQLITIAASFFLEGVSKPRRVMAVNLVILPLHAVLAYAWSGGHFGLPAWGALGAAWATTAAAACNAGLMLAAAWTLPDARARGIHAWRNLMRRETLAGAFALLAFGLMPALASGLELAGFSVLISLSTQLGETVTHAFAIVFSVHNLIFGVALGLGSAAGVRVGNAVGEGRPDQAAPRALIAMTLAAAATGGLALIILLASPLIIAAFPATQAVHQVAATMLPLWAPFILFDGVQVVFVYALRSLGDQVVAGVNSILAFFVITGGAGVLLVYAGWGAIGLVIASGAGMVAAALLSGARLWWVSRRFRSQS